MFYSIRFKTFKQMAYAFSLSDSMEGSRFYYCKVIVFSSKNRCYADSLWSFLKKMSDDPGEDFTLKGCSFHESEGFYCAL